MQKGWKRLRWLAMNAVLLILLFCLGCGVVYLSQYISQRGIIETAQTAAAEYAQTGSVREQDFIHTSIFAGDADSGEDAAVLLYYEIPGHPQAHRIVTRKLTPKHPRRTVYYTVHVYPKALSMAAFARVDGTGPQGQPVTITAVRSIQYTSSILITFLLIYLLAVCFLIAYMLLQRRANRRIAEIYERYIANVSHELKSPIASIQVITETLSEGYVKTEEELAWYYGIIDRESRRLAHSVLDIIELSRIQDHRRDLSRTQVDLLPILAGELEHAAPLCEDMGINLSLQLPGREPMQMPDSAGLLAGASGALGASRATDLLVKTNAEGVRQVLQILLDNAVKYVGEDGRICVTVRLQRRRLVVEVADDGEGIAPEELPHVFERFYRCAGHADAPGSGLGLAIAREIMTALGETIQAESTPGEGTIFRFTLRRAARRAL